MSGNITKKIFDSRVWIRRQQGNRLASQRIKYETVSRLLENVVVDVHDVAVFPFAVWSWRCTHCGSLEIVSACH
jgi:hypothetical protein